MPPASRGSSCSPVRHMLTTYNVRPHQCQRRCIAKLPPKPPKLSSNLRLPPQRAVKATQSQKVDTKKRWKTPFSRLSLPPAVQQLLQRVQPLPWFSRWIRRWVWRVFFLGPPIAVFIMCFPVTLMNVQGPSMAPLLNVHSSPEQPSKSPDRLFVLKAQIPEPLSSLFRLSKRKLARGQVVVYWTPHNPTGLAVKRVIALPGDRVRPLPGSPDGEDKPVIIPYNHIWVEGDANDRKKSVDSNTFGPISQNMVYGFVIGIYTPWLSWPVWPKLEEYDYPAKHSGRVEKDVVKNAKLDPDEAARRTQSPFKSGAAALELAMIRRHRHLMPTRMRNKAMLAEYRSMYELARSEAEKQDTSTREVAEGLIDELEIAFESVGLNKDGSRLAPTVKAPWQVALDEEDAADKHGRLQEYLARQPLQQDSASPTE